MHVLHAQLRDPGFIYRNLSFWRMKTRRKMTIIILTTSGTRMSYFGFLTDTSFWAYSCIICISVVLRSIGRLLSEPTLTITYTMATPADDHSEKVLVYHEWLNVRNVLEYFAACQLFWDPQCNNNILRMQSQHLGTSVNLDELKWVSQRDRVCSGPCRTANLVYNSQEGEAQPDRKIPFTKLSTSILLCQTDSSVPLGRAQLTVLKCNFQSTAVNCLSDSLSLIRPYKPEFSPRTGYQWWALRHQSYFHLAFTILRNIIDDSVEEGDDSNTNQLRNQPKRQVATIPGMMAALQTTRSHMEQQYQEKQKRAEQEAAANAVASSGTAPGTRPASVAPMTPAPDAIPRPPDADASAIASASKTPAPKGQGKKKQKRKWILTGEESVLNVIYRIVYGRRKGCPVKIPI
ncbi:Med6 domain-containing protein [Rhizoctonia solani AG-1 IA]|uniref:Mediator of RNA polymerase II transcription subunit 6 n=1 Tax=Thanatephorus cucumeris (strain AG1-IA) TaxID=983506 RepID=L8X6H6_THACA|nr:Med6 domain-containing protein [Rhizoctonia solani AG-1 IA]